MKKPLVLIVAATSLLFSLRAADAAVVLSDFSNLAAQSPTFSGSWRGGSPVADQFVQNSGFISLQPVNGGNPQDDGDFLVAPLAFSIAGLNQISLTARVDTGNAASSLIVLLYDNA